MEKYTIIVVEVNGDKPWTETFNSRKELIEDISDRCGYCIENIEDASGKSVYEEFEKYISDELH